MSVGRWVGAGDSHASLDLVVTSSFWRLHSSCPSLAPAPAGCSLRLASWGAQSPATRWSHRLIRLLLLVQRESTCRAVWQHGNIRVCAVVVGSLKHLCSETAARYETVLRSCTQKVMSRSAMTKALTITRGYGRDHSGHTGVAAPVHACSRIVRLPSVVWVPGLYGGVCEFLMAVAAVAACWTLNADLICVLSTTVASHPTYDMSTTLDDLWRLATDNSSLVARPPTS